MDINPVNFSDGDNETNVFDTNTIVIPVWPAAIGVTDTDKSFPISYSVGIASGYAAAAANGIVDQTPMIPFDVFAPAVQVGGPLYADKAGVAIPYALNGAKATALILHLHGRSGGPRAELQPLKG